MGRGNNINSTNQKPAGGQQVSTFLSVWWTCSREAFDVSLYVHPCFFFIRRQLQLLLFSSVILLRPWRNGRQKKLIEGDQKLLRELAVPPCYCKGLPCLCVVSLVLSYMSSPQAFSFKNIINNDQQNHPIAIPWCSSTPFHMTHRTLWCLTAHHYQLLI